MDHEKRKIPKKKRSVEHNMLLVQVMIIFALQYLTLSWGARGAAPRGKGRKLRRKFSRIGSEGNLFNATTLALEVQQRWKNEEIQNAKRNTLLENRKLSLKIQFS